MEEILQNSVVLRLLYKMVRGEISEIYPRIGYEDISYPVLNRLFGSDNQWGQLLDKLSFEGFLVKHVYDKVFRCPKCHSLNLRPKRLCPKCRSSNYVQGNVIVHYSCSYVDFEEKFIESETSLKCPKCGKSLKQIGIDYGNPGFAFKCLDCEEFFNLPLELWVCKSCEHQFQLHQAIVENIYSYRLNETVREKVEKVVLYTEPLAEFFRRKGFHVECFSEVKGKSGNLHMVDVFARNLSNSTKEFMIDIEEKENQQPITVEEVLKFIAKVLDVKTKNLHPILIAIPKVEKEAKTLTSKLGIDCVEAETLDLAVDKLEKTLKV